MTDTRASLEQLVDDMRSWARHEGDRNAWIPIGCTENHRVRQWADRLSALLTDVVRAQSQEEGQKMQMPLREGEVSVEAVTSRTAATHESQSQPVGSGSIGIRLIAAERTRQIDVEKWVPYHDDQHLDAELVSAAICYAEAGSGFDLSIGQKDGTKEPRLWPWESKWWKPSDDLVRNLAKAGALIAGEIDRLHRESGEDDGNQQPRRSAVDPVVDRGTEGSTRDQKASAPLPSITPDQGEGK